MRKAIAIDFDGCLVEEAWPMIGAPRLEVIQAAVRARENGAGLILWTCRTGARLAEAVEFCKSRGLEFDAVNANLPERVQTYGADSRKVSADEYWDDRAVTAPVPDMFTLDQAAELLREAFGDGCPCNYNGIDEWLPQVCRFCKTGDCPDPPGELACWKEFIRQRGRRDKGA